MLTNDTVAPTATQPDPTAARAGLETVTCSRCCGTGNYSYCQMYGTTCFKCQGRKVVFTKRGATAAVYLDRLRSKPASEIAVGDVIREESVCAGAVGCFTYSFWAKVAKVERRGDGTIAFTYELNAHLTGSGGIASDKLIRVAQTAAQKRATLALAVAYQATLKADGKPYKRPPTARTRPVLSDAEKAARKAARVAQKAQETEARVAAAREALNRQEVRDALAAKPHPRGFYGKTGEPLTALDWAVWMMANAGTAGRLDVAKAVEAAVNAPARGGVE